MTAEEEAMSVVFGPPYTSDEWYWLFPLVRAGNLTADELEAAKRLHAQSVKVPWWRRWIGGMKP